MKNNYLKAIIMNKDKQKINLRIFSKNINYLLFHGMNTKIIFRKIISFIIKILFIICFFLPKNVAIPKINRILFGQYKITLKINKSGHHKIFNKLNGKDICEHEYTNQNNYPNEIIINTQHFTNSNNAIEEEYDLTQESNTIILIWNSEINSCDNLFKDCSSIEEIDLSEFSTPNVKCFTGMFNGTSSLTSINFNNFNTQSAERMDWMFHGCSSLTILDISNFNTQNVKNMRIMFGFCISLTSLNLLNFNTENVIDMGYIFFHSYNLTSIDLSNFKTSSVELFDYMFSDCIKLISLDITNFNTSNAKHMEFMFHHCASLISLDLSHFDTSKVTTMLDMFSHCYNLVSIDVSSFDTSSVSIMQGMFGDCYKLISLNLNHFNTSNVINMSWMFVNCLELTDLKIDNFDTSSVENMEFMFYQCQKLNSLDISGFRTSNVKSMAAMFVGCLGKSSLDLSHFDTSLVTSFLHMFEDCQFTSLDLSNFAPNNVKNAHAMFLNCKKLTSVVLSKFFTSKIDDIEYMFAGCDNLKYIDIKKITIPEHSNYTQIIQTNLKNTIICIVDKSSLEKMFNLYDWAYVNCSGEWGENKDKISSSDDNICTGNCLLSKYKTGCYQICSYYFFFDEYRNRYICTRSLECPNTHKKLIIGKNECVKSCESTKETKFEFNNNCLKECPENFIAFGNDNFCTPVCPKESPFLYLNTFKCTPSCTITERQNGLCIANYFPKAEDNFNILDKVIEQTRNELLNNFDPSVVNGKYIKEKGAKMIIKKTNDKNKDGFDIDLSECEEKLKEHYPIDPDDSLYMFLINIEQKGTDVGSFEYELLHPLGGQNLVKLDLSYCKDVKVKFNILFNLTDELEKYNSSSPYYNDICYIADTNEGTDLTLSQRQNNYVDNNMQICETDCDFISYNTETQKAVCSCGIKLEVPLLDNVKIDKELLLNSFTDINNFANVKMMTCYKTVFQKKLIIKNIGFFLFIILIILNIICLFLFLFKYWKKLVRLIKKIKSNILKEIKEKNTLNKKSKNLINRINFKNKSKAVKSSARKIKSINIENIPDKNKKIKSIRLKRVNNHSPPKSKKVIKLNEIKFNNKNNIKNNNNDKKRKAESFDKKRIKNNKKIINANNDILNINSLNKRIKSINKSILKNKKKIILIYSEMNDLSFEDALINDQRTCTLYYLSLLKINHPLLSIFNKVDYNSLPIKLSIFLFKIGSDVAVNSLFFNDSTMNKIYTDGGSYNFIYQIPQIIYSSIISSIISWLITLLGLTEKSIINFKKMNTKKKSLSKEYNKLIAKLKAKIVFFYFFIFSFLFLFGYYLICFCGIYRNTQIHLIKDSAISFSLSLITPFFIYLIPAFFRITSLKRKSKYMYKVSQFLEIF